MLRSLMYKAFEKFSRIVLIALVDNLLSFYTLFMKASRSHTPELWGSLKRVNITFSLSLNPRLREFKIYLNSIKLILELSKTVRFVPAIASHTFTPLWSSIMFTLAISTWYYSISFGSVIPINTSYFFSFFSESFIIFFSSSSLYFLISLMTIGRALTNRVILTTSFSIDPPLLSLEYLA